MATSNGLPYPTLSDAPNLPANLQALAEAVDSRYGLTVANAAALSGVTSPFKGMRVLLDDTDEIAVYDGAAWGGYVVNYTPTWSAATTPPTLGATVVSGRYVRVGHKLVDFEIQIAVGAGVAAGTGFYTFSLPVTAHADLSAHWPVGGGTFFDTSVPTVYTRRLALNSSTTVVMRDDAGTAVGAAAPVVPASGDRYMLQGRYRAA